MFSQKQKSRTLKLDLCWEIQDELHCSTLMLYCRPQRHACFYRKRHALLQYWTLGSHSSCCCLTLNALPTGLKPQAVAHHCFDDWPAPDPTSLCTLHSFHILPSVGSDPPQALGIIPTLIQGPLRPSLLSPAILLTHTHFANSSQPLSFETGSWSHHLICTPFLSLTLRLCLGTCGQNYACPHGPLPTCSLSSHSCPRLVCSQIPKGFRPEA